MRRLFPLLVCVLAGACSGSSNTPRKLVLLHTNDEHSHLLGYGPESDDFPIDKTAIGTGTIVGGASRRSVVLAQERQKAKDAGADVLTVSAGDNMMGTVAQLAATLASPDFRVMKALGYDVTTLGNHEFDYGPDALRQSIAAAMAQGGMVPTVASNIHFSGSSSAADAKLAALFDETGDAPGEQKPLHRSLIVTTPNGLRVGFVGIVGADAANVAPLKAPVTFSISALAPESNLQASLHQVFLDMQKVVDALRAQKVDLVVALSHSGVNLSRPEQGEDYQIAQNVSGLDVIVSGHSHTTLKALQVQNLSTGKPVLIQQAGRFGDAVGRLNLSVANGNVSFDPGSDIVPVDDRTPPSSDAVNAIINQVYGGLETLPIAQNLSFMQITLLHIKGTLASAVNVGDLLFNTPLSTLGFEVKNDQAHTETPLLDLSADALLDAANQDGLIDAAGIDILPNTTDLAANAAGALRVSKLERSAKHAGQLGFADVFRVVPLGGSPVTNTPGYPLTRFAIFGVELRAAFEVTAGLSYAGDANAQFFLVPAGMRFEYDTSRAPFNQSDPLNPANGRVTKILRFSESPRPGYHAIWDSTNPTAPGAGWKGVSPFAVYNIATNLYVATFAYLAGVVLKNPANPKQIYTDPSQAIVRRKADQSEIKEWEALGSYIYKASAQNAGALPSMYDKADPAYAAQVRAKCSGPLCQPVQ